MENTGVANLSTGFGVERREVEDELGLTIVLDQSYELYQ